MQIHANDQMDLDIRRNRILPENPLITVVIPTFNRLELLLQAIRSVTEQTYHQWELIIVDDGSTDGTAHKIRSMVDCRIRVLSAQHEGNVANLRNKGAAAGCGDWLAFLDSDDILTPQSLEIQLRSLQLHKKRWGYGRFELMDETMKTIPLKAGSFQTISGWIIKDVLATNTSIAVDAMMIEKSLFEELNGFNTRPDLLYREDYDLTLRLALKAEAQAIPELVVRVREHPGRSTNTAGDGHNRSISVYEHFLGYCPSPDLAKMARKRMAHELAELASEKIGQKEYLPAMRQLKKAFLYGDRWRHLLSVIRRGLKH